MRSELDILAVDNSDVIPSLPEAELAIFHKETGFSFQTTLLEVAKTTNIVDVKKNECAGWLKDSPQPKKCIELHVTRLREYYESIPVEIIGGNNQKHPLDITDWPPDFLAYYCTVKGYYRNVTLAHFGKHLCYYDDVREEEHLKPLLTLRESLWAITSGIGDAFVLPFLMGLEAGSELAEFTAQAPDYSAARLKWLGTPSQFGFVAQELIGKGYLEAPASSNTKSATAFMKHFEIGTTQGTLAKELSTGESGNSLSAANRNRFKIPDISKLR